MSAIEETPSGVEEVATFFIAQQQWAKATLRGVLGHTTTADWMLKQNEA